MKLGDMARIGDSVLYVTKILDHKYIVVDWIFTSEPSAVTVTKDYFKSLPKVKDLSKDAKERMNESLHREGL